MLVLVTVAPYCTRKDMFQDFHKCYNSSTVTHQRSHHSGVFRRLEHEIIALHDGSVLGKVWGAQGSAWWGVLAEHKKESEFIRHAQQMRV